MSTRVFSFNVRFACLLLMCLLILLATSLVAATGQSKQARDPQEKRDDTVTLKAHLVSIDVMVRDRNGKSIADLKAEDFSIFEDGVQQKIEIFDPPLESRIEKVRPNAGAEPEPKTSTGRPPNIISLVLDAQTTEFVNMKQVQDGTLKYIRERISDNDMVAVFAVTNGLRLLQPFTHDKAKLVSAVEKTYSATVSSKTSERNEIAAQIAELQDSLKNSGAGIGDPNTNAGARLAQLQAMVALRALQQFTLLRSQLSLQQSRPVLAALAGICEAQRAIPGKKTVILFSQGFITSATQDWQVQGTIDIANRANVAVYIIDSAGLNAGAPQSGSLVPASPLEGISSAVNSEARIRAVGGENVFDNARHEGLNRQHDILYRVSEDTGGKFIKGTNDIYKGLDRIDGEIRSRYTLGYYSTNPNFDGSFRKLKIEARRPEARVIARSGYYAIANEGIVPLSAEERKLLETFGAAENTPGFPLFVELSPFRSQEGRYVVTVSIEVPPSALRFNRKKDKQQLNLDVLGLIREGDNRVLSRLGGGFDIELTDDQYQSILSNKVFYKQDVELDPGTYRVDLMIRDRLSGKMAARREELALPLADKEFSATKAVLSRHVDSLRKLPAEQGAGGSSGVLTYGGAQIRPSPSREFRATDNLIIFFELYNAAQSDAGNKPLVNVNVRIMKDGKLAIKPADYVLTESAIQPVPHLTFAKYTSLAGLAPGKYVALIEARDMLAQKLVAQQLPFVITP